MPSQRNRLAFISTVLAAAWLLAGGAARGQVYDFQTIDGPLGAGNFGDSAESVQGNDIVGYYYTNESATDYSGFLYNGANYTIFNDPLAANATSIENLDGSEQVGAYTDNGNLTHAFTYLDGNYTTLDDPNAGTGAGQGTIAFGISGGNIVGFYLDGSDVRNGFIYNGTSFTTLNDPLGTNGTVPEGISGNDIVGYYIDADDVRHGFFYNGTTFTTIDDPSAGTSAGNGTAAVSTDGTDIVGYYYNNSGIASGFLFNGTTYTTINNSLGVNGTYVFGLSDGNISGAYLDSTGLEHAFLGTPVPEPAAWSLLAGGFALAGAAGWRRRRV
jgi:hypothetical protein